MNWHDRGVTAPVAFVAAMALGLVLLGAVNNHLGLAQSGLTFAVIAMVLAVEKRIEVKVHDLRRRIEELEAKRR